jgi:hypothetical protein
LLLEVTNLSANLTTKKAQLQEVLIADLSEKEKMKAHVQSVHLSVRKELNVQSAENVESVLLVRIATIHGQDLKKRQPCVAEKPFLFKKMMG